MLQDAANNLQLVEAVQAVVPNWPPLGEVSGEETVEGVVVQVADNLKVCAEGEAVEMPDPVVEPDFEDEDGQDGASAIDHSRTLKIEFDPSEVSFWFTQLENEMYTCSVKSQWLKRCVLVKNLPSKVQSDVKSLLELKKSACPPLIYKKVKEEILRLHAPKEEDSFKKALSRVLVGLPSQLGEQLVNDVCKNPVRLSCGCCYRAIKTLWTLQLPDFVKSQIANMDFNQETYRQVFQAADKIFLSRQTPELASSVAAVVTVPKASASSSSPSSAAEVAAFKPNGKGNRNNGGGGKNNKGNSSGGGGGSGSGGGNGRRGPRHSSNPPGSCCDNHYRWGAQSWFCLAPLTCPWKDKIGARPKKENKD